MSLINAVSLSINAYFAQNSALSITFSNFWRALYVALDADVHDGSLK